MDYKLAFGEMGSELRNGIENLTDKYKYSTKHRKIRMFHIFTEFIEQCYGTLTNENIERICSHFRLHVYTERGKNSISTAHSNYSSWARLMQDLIQAGYLPFCTIPKGFQSSHELLKDSTFISCLGTMNPKQWKKEMHSRDLPNLQEMDDAEYLSTFMDSQLIYRNQLLSQARSYIKDAATRFTQGQKYIKQTDPILFEAPNLLHPDLKGKGTGQHLSLFSAYLPNQEGLKNLVAFLHYRRNRLIHRDFCGANNHLYRFGGRVFLQEHLGLSSDLAAACAIVIVAETGINPESLYRLKFNPKTKTIIPHDTLDAYILNYDKPRAGGPISRLIKRASSEVNTEYCFDLIETMTSHLRDNASDKVAKNLFIHDGVQKIGQIESITSTAFKQAFQRLVIRSNNSDLINSKPNLSKLRVTGGLLAWHQSGGDPRAAARFLGNSPQVAIKNYIPRELQEFFYRKQIRQFQHLLIAVSTDRKPYQQEALNIKNVVDLNHYLTTHVENSTLYRRARSAILEKDELEGAETNLTFIISENNIAFLHASQQHYEKCTDASQVYILKKWAEIATLIFQFIRSQGTRAQQRTMAKGIEKNKNNPLTLSYNP